MVEAWGESDSYRLLKTRNLLRKKILQIQEIPKVGGYGHVADTREARSHFTLDALVEHVTIPGHRQPK